ncbi:hypothetical protein B0H14DRAFT_2680424 [Mycena olivaceomarginata]|nr:hypothetical protein B0H14DRAFT_2706319 [Mycena olivaceomarginata]KAJ7896099.1 hypothetical protein B0H14DRAFT_2680424 [Mycena olivaceomarginata]
MNVLHPAVRPRSPASLPRVQSSGYIDIFHPQVPDLYPFLCLAVFPSNPDTTGISGFPLGTLLDACSILAHNHRGRLVLTTTDERVGDDDSDPDLLVPPGNYIFIVVNAGTDDMQYSLCPSFEDWTPPSTLPVRWQSQVVDPRVGPSAASDLSSSVRHLDAQRCIVTGGTTDLHASYLVPRSADQWFKRLRKQIVAYGGHVSDLNSVLNTVTLRGDLNARVEQGDMLFVPYEKAVVPLIVHHLAQDLAYEYHLRSTRFPLRIRSLYLYIRLSWAILKFCSPELEDTIRALKALKAARQQKRKAEHSQCDNDSGNNSTDASEDTTDESGFSTSSVSGFDEELMALYEAQDAELSARGFISFDDELAGHYPGFSAYKRIAMEYKAEHPNIAASSTVWEDP